MTQSHALTKSSVKAKALATAAAVVAAVALPQAFHLTGVAFGIGASLGEAFLPMQIPVLLVGLFAGPAAGFAAGVLSPLASYALTGMPVAHMLPFLVAELVAYGVVSGIMGTAKASGWATLLASQIAGRAVKAVAVLFAVYVLGSHAAPVSLIWGAVVAGIPGILLQWALVPAIASWARNRADDRA